MVDIASRLHYRAFLLALLLCLPLEGDSRTCSGIASSTVTTGIVEVRTFTAKSADITPIFPTASIATTAGVIDPVVDDDDDDGEYFDEPLPAITAGKRSSCSKKPSKLTNGGGVAKGEISVEHRVIEGLPNFLLGGGKTVPDQALCVGPTMVLAGVNDAWAFYDKDTFQQIRVFHPNALFDESGVAGDPQCVYDGATESFFLVSHLARQRLGVTVVPGLWDFASPLKGAKFNFSDVGRDQPFIGTDAYSFWITFDTRGIPPIREPGAVFLGFDKFALAAGGPARWQQFTNPRYDGFLLVHLRPQELQRGSSPDTSNGGTMYFLSRSTVYGSQVIVSAITHTSNIALGLPTGDLLTRVITTVKATLAIPKLTEPPAAAPQLLTSRIDYRMQHAVYAKQTLYGVAMTGAYGDMRQVAIVYYIFEPSVVEEQLKVVVVNTDVLFDIANNHMPYPSIGVAPSGDAVIAFSYVGPTQNSSLGYIRLSAEGKPASTFFVPMEGTVRRGELPQKRWGDYSACMYDNLTGRFYYAAMTAKNYWTSWMGYVPL